MDNGWRAVNVEPERVEVNANIGLHDVNDIGPTMELIVGGSHHANDNGYPREAEEPRQTLLSWEEFMAEKPVKPKRRRRKPQPASLSIFEWALSLEKEREAELVGVIA